MKTLIISIVCIMIGCSGSAPNNSNPNNCSAIRMDPNPYNSNAGCQMENYCKLSSPHTYMVNCSPTYCVCWIDPGSGNGYSHSFSNDGSFCFDSNSAFDACQYPHE